MIKLETLHVHKIVCTASCGVHLGSAIKEATILALTEDAVVELVFNDKKYSIVPDTIRSVIAESGQ